MGKIVRLLTTSLALTAIGFAAVAGYRMVETQLEADIYRQRLHELEGDLALLRDQYLQAIRKTAVTELVVEGDSLSVNVRAGDGSTLSLPTPYDPSLEIYVDYVVQDGRLWIRRIFDENTAPGDAMVIDPALGSVDWDGRGATLGKAAYRSLGEGRWIVTVSGDGSLGLARAREDEVVRLAPAPPVREYAPVAQEAEQALRELQPSEILRALASRLAAG